MGYEQILYGVEAGVATVTLNRPDKLNAWTTVMEQEVRAAMHAAAADDAGRAIVLTGAGRGFCAGADMGRLNQVRTGDAAPIRHAEPAADDGSGIRPDFRTRHTYFPAIPKPVIAAINGPCAGVGMVVALYADLRFGGPPTMFTTAFARRGLIAEYGIAWMLPHLVGHAAALDLLMSARRVGADEALRLGLLNHLEADAAAGAQAYARDLAANVSPRSMRVIKRQVWEARFQALGEAIENSHGEMDAAFQSDDFREGIAHFLEKRPPAFTGR